MKCLYCREKAGILKRVCGDCLKLVKACQSLPESFGYRVLLDRLMETNVSNEKIELFLHADIDGQGSVNDRITARMTNEVMAGLGQPSHMMPKDVKKVREDIAAGRPPSIIDQEVTDYSQLPNKK